MSGGAKSSGREGLRVKKAGPRDIDEDGDVASPCPEAEDWRRSRLGGGEGEGEGEDDSDDDDDGMVSEIGFRLP